MTFHYALEEPCFSAKLEYIDRAIESATPQAVPELFKDIPIDVFALLLAHRPSRFPNLLKWLPALPSPDVQKMYVGFSGEEAMLRSSSFVSEVCANYESLSGRPISESSILDYGVGWGRILRLFYKYVPTNQTYGVDALKSSYGLATSLGLRSTIKLVPELPGPTQVADRKMDLIWAFSVFTHLSEAATGSVLQAIGETLSPDGVAVVTIRPEHALKSHFPHLESEYRSRGFSFSPQKGQANYGDTVMSVEFFQKRWPEWNVRKVTWDQHNHLQLKLYITKK